MDFMYYGETLVVDLEAGTSRSEDLTEVDEFGPGLAAGLALHRKYEDSNPLVIGSGLITGTTAPASCLGFVVGKSPLTGELSVAPLPLFAGAEVKLSGFAMVVITGESTKPVYLWLHDGVADILEASELAGLDTWETTDRIRRDMGEPLIQVLSIGLAGEARSELASYSINYWGSGDTAALGAVMGAKNLKAVAVRGLGMLDADDPQEFYRASTELLPRLPAEKGFGGICSRIGIGDVDAWLEPLIHRYRSCFACPSACATFVKYREPPDVLESTGVEEPGMLVTGAAAAAWLHEGGWNPEPASRALEAIARQGIDMLRGARELAKKPLEDETEIVDAAKSLTGSEEAAWPSGESVAYRLFGPWVPPLAPEREWLAANWLGYVLGICPTYMLTSGLDVADLCALCSPAAGVELDPEAIAEMLS
jgi:aldehyde:ferredoxin oxidoreductase